MDVADGRLVRNMAAMMRAYPVRRCRAPIPPRPRCLHVSAPPERDSSASCKRSGALPGPRVSRVAPANLFFRLGYILYVVVAHVGVVPTFFSSRARPRRDECLSLMNFFAPFTARGRAEVSSEPGRRAGLFIVRVSLAGSCWTTDYYT